MVFTAFLFSRAVTQTGFGTRVGYVFIERFARTPLRLGYSMAAADLVLAPFIPSDTARGGGVVFPITRSVAAAFGSEPGPTARLMGSFLVLVSFHTTYTASAMFLTGMAANPLIAEFAYKIAHVELTWGRWFAGSSLPGFLALTFMPWLLFRLMFSSGVVKVRSGDRTWRTLTALTFHYETQPLPTPLAWLPQDPLSIFAPGHR